MLYPDALVLHHVSHWLVLDLPIILLLLPVSWTVELTC
jgi:hypothetical protein